MRLCVLVLVVGLVQAYPKPLPRRLAHQRTQRMRTAFYVRDSDLCSSSSQVSQLLNATGATALGFGGDDDDDDDEEDENDYNFSEEEYEEENNHNECPLDSAGLATLVG